MFPIRQTPEFACGALLGRRQIQLDVVAGRVVQILVHSQILFGRKFRCTAYQAANLRRRPGRRSENVELRKTIACHLAFRTGEVPLQSL